MEECHTRIIYRSEESALYEDTFIDGVGTKRTFYCLIVESNAYALSREEGVVLERKVAESYKSFHHEGIEMALIQHSFNCVIDNLH